MFLGDFFFSTLCYYDFRRNVDKNNLSCFSLFKSNKTKLQKKSIIIRRSAEEESCILCKREFRHILTPKRMHDHCSLVSFFYFIFHHFVTNSWMLPLYWIWTQSQCPSDLHVQYIVKKWEETKCSLVAREILIFTWNLLRIIKKSNKLNENDQRNRKKE